MVNSTRSKNSRTSSRNPSLTASELESYSAILNGSENKPEIVPLIGKFAKLKYGNNKEIIFNVNCQVQFLIDYFKLKCKEAVGDKIIDLADLDGNLKNFRDKSYFTKIATEVLTPRDVYILVEIKATDVKNVYNIEPLLTDSELISQNFLKKLSQQSKSISKNTSSASSNRLTSSRASIANPVTESKRVVSTNKSIALNEETDNVSALTSFKSRSTRRKTMPANPYLSKK